MDELIRVRLELIRAIVFSLCRTAVFAFAINPTVFASLEADIALGTVEFDNRVPTVRIF